MSVVGGLHSRTIFPRRVRVLASHLAVLVPQGAKVLDVGCGDGALARAVMELRPDVDIVGIDVLRRPNTRISVSQFDGEVVPYGDSSFEAVTLIDVLHHARNPMALLREAARVASRAVIIKDHLANGTLARSTLRLMDWVGNAHHGVDLPYTYWSSERWRQAFDHLGLSTQAWKTDLGLYPVPARWVFERGLHVLCRLDVPSSGRQPTAR